jgi:hypothetical protein
VQYWDGGAWATVPGGSVNNNDKVWRRFAFAPVATTRIRVSVRRGLFNHAQIAEVAAWTAAAGGPTPTPTPSPTPNPTPTPPAPGGNPTNFALAGNGGVATASSSFSSAYPASAAINGDRRGSGYGGGGVWADATPGAYPDTLEIAFNGSKTISEVGVFTVQDNFSTPAEPTGSMTFSQYGNRDFEVQYWDGGAWVTVPGGAVANNSNVWRRFTFAPVTTAKIRVMVTRAQFGHSQIAEVEAWGT